MFKVWMTFLDTFHPFLYTGSTQKALTGHPVSVADPRMQANTVSKVRQGVPAQLILMGPNNRCSIGFHLEAPVG